MNYKVLYASVGLLSGRQPGETVTLTDPHDAAQLLNLGLIAPEDEASQEAQGKTVEQLAEERRAAEDTRLAPFKGEGGWYTFPATEEGGEPLKVQGREKALAELARRETSSDAGQPADGE